MNTDSESSLRAQAENALAITGPYAFGPFVSAVGKQVASMATDPEGTPRTLPEALRVVAADLLFAAFTIDEHAGNASRLGCDPSPAPTFCPACGKGVAVRGNVFCGSGEYYDEFGEYAYEGDATVYICANGHSFAWEPPYGEEAEDEPTCTACGREESTCSRTPCSSVIRDRGEGERAS